MAQPSDKAPAIENMLSFLSGKNRVEVIKAGLCMTCTQQDAVRTLLDELSGKEYTISGMCQQCQDKAFE